MKRALIEASVGLGFGVVLIAWIFTPHSWNPGWLVSIQLPGMYLGAWLTMLARERAAVPLFLTGMAMQWILLGAVFGFALYKVHVRKHHPTNRLSQ